MPKDTRLDDEPFDEATHVRLRGSLPHAPMAMPDQRLTRTGDVPHGAPALLSGARS